VAVALHQARELVGLRRAHGDRELRVLAGVRHVVVDDADVQDVALVRRASYQEQSDGGPARAAAARRASARPRIVLLLLWDLRPGRVATRERVCRRRRARARDALH